MFKWEQFKEARRLSSTRQGWDVTEGPRYRACLAMEFGEGLLVADRGCSKRCRVNVGLEFNTLPCVR